MHNKYEIITNSCYNKRKEKTTSINATKDIIVSNTSPYSVFHSQDSEKKCLDNVSLNLSQVNN